VFDDLDVTLTRLLNDAPQAELPQLRNADVSFETPDKSFAPGQETVDLFLYEVRENRELRDPTPILERQGDDYLRRPPPIRADCSYIVTAWSTALAGPARIAAEHRLLGQALTWLGRFATIPTRYLQGLLASPRRIYPLPVTVAQLDPNQHAGDFWVAMGIAPRPAFYLMVTTEVAIPTTTQGPLVTAAEVGYQMGGDAATAERWVNFGGTVRDHAGGLVPGAWVRLEPGGRVEVTDGDGRFVFTEVPPGTGYTLHGQALGQAPTSRGVDLPDPSGQYDLQFP
jgi:Pvc16 N-terminal domain/Carboxypeptidase regulatory-like domain